MGFLVFYIYIIEQHTIYFMSTECALMMQCHFLSSGRQTSLICLFQRSQHYLQHHMQSGCEDFKHVSWNDTSGTFSLRITDPWGRILVYMKNRVTCVGREKGWNHLWWCLKSLKHDGIFLQNGKAKSYTRNADTIYDLQTSPRRIRIEISGCWEEANNNKMFNTINFNKITKTNLVGTIGWNQILPRARKQRKEKLSGSENWGYNLQLLDTD